MSIGRGESRGGNTHTHVQYIAMVPLINFVDQNLRLINKKHDCGYGGCFIIQMCIIVQSPSVDLDSLPEEQRTEAERFLEAIGEEEKEKADLLQRKKEIQERITAQEKELVEAQERVATLETKVQCMGDLAWSYYDYTQKACLF